MQVVGGLGKEGKAYCDDGRGHIFDASLPILAATLLSWAGEAGEQDVAGLFKP